MDIKLAIVGSRTFNDYDTLKKVVDKIVATNNVTHIISGGAMGADTLAERYADENKIEKIIFIADWRKYGKKAGFIRNIDIIKNCDVCIAFWDGKSHGTQHDINLCKEYHKKCYICNFINNTITVGQWK